MMTATAATTFRIVLQTQVYENYGSHCWDGTGHCPQHWKAKGGNEYQQPVGDANDVAALGQAGLQDIANKMANKVAQDNDSWREWQIDWNVVPSTEDSNEEKLNREMLDDGYMGQEEFDRHAERLRQPTLS